MTHTSPHKSSPLPNLIAAVIIIVHLAIALFSLDLYDLSRDEARYWEVSGRTLPGMIEWSAADNYPPLLFILMAAWRPLFGESEAGLRFPFAIFSALSLFVFWRILRRKPWLSSTDALWVLALVALSPMQIFIATLAKYYTLLELLGLLFWFGMEQLMAQVSRGSGAGILPARSEVETGNQPARSERGTDVPPVSSERETGVSPVMNEASNFSTADGRDARPPLNDVTEEINEAILNQSSIDKKSHARLLTAIVFVALAMVYLHYLGFVILASFFLAAIVVHGWRPTWNLIKAFRWRALILVFYLPWFAVFLHRTWANLGETTDLTAEQGGGALRHLAGLLVTPYGLFWGNSLEPWHFGLVGLSILLILIPLTLFLIHLFRTLTRNRNRTRSFPNLEHEHEHELELKHEHKPELDRSPSPFTHPSFRFLWLFLIFSFVFTFLIITFFMRIPILFYAERFTFILPFFLAAILLSWPRRWRRPVFALTLCLFLFADYNFFAKRECLNWSYNIPWNKIELVVKNEMKIAGNQKPTFRQVILYFDNKSFGALGEYYFRECNSYPIWGWDDAERFSYFELFHEVVGLLGRSEEINGETIVGDTPTFRQKGDPPFRPKCIILIRSSTDTYPGQALNKFESDILRYYNLKSETGYVQEINNFEAMKNWLFGSYREIYTFKMWVKIYDLKESDPQ